MVMDRLYGRSLRIRISLEENLDVFFFFYLLNVKNNIFLFYIFVWELKDVIDL